MSVKVDFYRGDADKVEVKDGQLLFDLEKKSISIDAEVDGSVERIEMTSSIGNIDIDDQTLADGDILVYDGETGEWTNGELGSAANLDVPTSGDATSSQVVMGNDSRLTDARPASDVLSWAKAESKPLYQASEVGAYTTEEVNNLIAALETGMDWKEAVDTYEDIEIEYPEPEIGWTVNVKDTNYTYRYDGEDWVAVSANAIPEATSSVNGLMTASMVDKLDSISQGAEVNVQADWNEADSSDDAFIKNKPTIPSKISDLTNDSNFVVDANYVHTDNNFTTALKDKLDGVTSGAEPNVQADWNETNSSSDAFIQNKPTIPEAQIQADWDQADSSALDYIKNKPTLGIGTITSVKMNGFTVATSGEADLGTVLTSHQDVSGKMNTDGSNSDALVKLNSALMVGTSYDTWHRFSVAKEAGENQDVVCTSQALRVGVKEWAVKYYTLRIDDPSTYLRMVDDTIYYINIKSIETVTVSTTNDFRLVITAKLVDDVVDALEDTNQGARIYVLPQIGTNSILLGNASGSALGKGSFAVGNSAIALGNYSHAEGGATLAEGDYNHVEGHGAKASSYYSHAEGGNTRATNYMAHAEGESSEASGYCSHAQNWYTKATGYYSHSEGFYTEANGNSSHASGYQTVADYGNQFVCGRNNDNKATTLFEVGKSYDNQPRANAFEVYDDGSLSTDNGTTRTKLPVIKRATLLTGANTVSFTDTPVQNTTTVLTYPVQSEDVTVFAKITEVVDGSGNSDLITEFYTSVLDLDYISAETTTSNSGT